MRGDFQQISLNSVFGDIESVVNEFNDYFLM